MNGIWAFASLCADASKRFVHNWEVFTDSKIKMVCENKFDSKPKVHSISGGLGNELIQKRLQLIYADKHLLEINRNNELYSVHLTITNG